MSATATRQSASKIDIRVGFMPLVDCAPVIVAARLGFAEKEGLRLLLARESSWAALRDRISVGHLDAAHMLAPMPIAANLGLMPFAARLVARAEGRYVRAAALDRMLTTDGRLAFRAMFGVYRSLLGAVRRAGRGIFTRRVKPAKPRLLAAAARTLLLGP